ncbi:hypothetical protein BGZ60DRAFT_534285 [Tricladium varicosporioides]|nr:hypothetical protein BGZ60DRAFT_534285 [Hymenoscyphus varicosporioides]
MSTLLKDSLTGECTIVAPNSTTSVTYPGVKNVTSQEDTNTFFQGCTTIRGDITFDYSYSGSFSLPGVIKIDGSIYTQRNDDWPVSSSKLKEYETRGLTAVVLNDLKEIRNFGIIGVPNMNSVSMTRLERVDNVDIFANAGTTVNFPILKSANYLTLRGNVSSISMTLLKTVSKGIEIVQTEPYYQWESVSSHRSLGIAFDLSALEFAQRLMLKGNFTKFSLPQLTSVPVSLGIHINQTIAINLPALTTISSAHIGGALSGTFSLPSLTTVAKSYPGGLILNFFDLPKDNNKRVFVDLPNLSNASDVEVQGPLTGVSLPALDTLPSTLIIKSTIPFNCDPSRALWDRLSTSFNTSHPDPKFLVGREFQCESDTDATAEPKYLGLTRKVWIGIGVGSLVWCMLSCVVTFLIWRFWAQRRARVARNYPRPAVMSNGQGIEEGNVIPPETITATTTTMTRG